VNINALRKKIKRLNKEIKQLKEEREAILSIQIDRLCEILKGKFDERRSRG
jgi:hypothetical protein